MLPLFMTQQNCFTSLSPAIAGALTRHGFTSLTPVQEAVLNPALSGRDLRIFSQTGSGKTVAVGLVLAAELERAPADSGAPVNSRAPAESGAPELAPKSVKPVQLAQPARPVGRPEAILIAPTRELAAQLARELTWLFEPIGAKVCAVTGGSSYANELRALRQGPRIIVGTPGRLLDHLERGSIDASAAKAVVLDEADQMLDLGFRDELEAILGRIPAERRTLLVSATFSREVRALADRYQTDAVVVEGTRIGVANQDIAHVAHLVRHDEREAALVNLLLLAPNERALVFVRTRADASDIADNLSARGFRARALSGELEQSERTRTLDAFRSGAITTLVATDVAARGLDIPEVSRVIHADPPGDADALTHRSGRTGRAGRKGTSIVLAPPAAREHVSRLFRRARVEVTFRRAPSPEDVRAAADERLSAELRGGSDASPASTKETADPRLRALATELLASMSPEDLVTALLARARGAGPCEPLPVTAIEPPPPAADRRDDPRWDNARPPQLSFVPFRITWGERHGADARRLLAMVCRRGNIKGSEVGAIRVGPAASTFEVAESAAESFARLVQKPDARDPRIRIDRIAPFNGGGPAPRGRSAPRTPYSRPRRPEAPPA
jgi:ATP-dependent RNA helicase DeaD